jgi:hypothetical protein
LYVGVTSVTSGNRRSVAVPVLARDGAVMSVRAGAIAWSL